MDRAERIALMVDALTAGTKDDHNVVQLVDLGQREHWVRVWDFGEDPNTHLTVTNRASPGSPLPPLTGKQIDRLVALGLGREARPDFEGDVTDADADALAERVECIFETLGSAEDFELAAGLGHGERPAPNPQLLDVYGGATDAPDWNTEAPGDEELLGRIKEAQASYRTPTGEVAEVQPPFVMACMKFHGEYQGFVNEDAIMLRTISDAMQRGDLTGEQAREAYRPYARFAPEIYDLDYEEENEWGFPLCTDDMDDLSVSRIGREADAAGIPGVGVAWGNLSPMSGEPLNVEGEDALDRLRQHFQGRYLIVNTGTEYWWDIAPDDAQRRIEAARTEGRE